MLGRSSRARFLAPNLVTVFGLLFGLGSLVATHEHRFMDAAWLIVWAVLIDRLDGLIARALNATSSFGVQMDSFADAINFGIAPALLAFVLLSRCPDQLFGNGIGRSILMVSCCLWVLAAVVRLAKFNVISAKASHTFFGVPTTLCAGTLATWILVLGKYADPSSGMQPQAGPKLLGEWSLGPSVWNVLPACMIFGAVLMVSNLPMPKLGLLRSRLLNLVVLTNVLAGYACGFARIIPEYMVVLPTMWLLIGLSWGSIAPQARLCRPPSFLPR